jgi:hypothetical protein
VGCGAVPALEESDQPHQRQQQQQVSRAAPISGVGLAASAWACVACFSRSGMATTEASAVSFNTLMQLLVNGGTTMRSACGSTTSRMRLKKPRPMASAASNWPLGMASMPARRISAV